MYFNSPIFTILSIFHTLDKISSSPLPNVTSDVLAKRAVSDAIIPPFSGRLQIIGWRPSADSFTISLGWKPVINMELSYNKICPSMSADRANRPGRLKWTTRALWYLKKRDSNLPYAFIYLDPHVVDKTNLIEAKGKIISFADDIFRQAWELLPEVRRNGFTVLELHHKRMEFVGMLNGWGEPSSHAIDVEPLMSFPLLRQETFLMSVLMCYSRSHIISEETERAFRVLLGDPVMLEEQEKEWNKDWSHDDFRRTIYDADVTFSPEPEGQEIARPAPSIQFKILGKPAFQVEFEKFCPEVANPKLLVSPGHTSPDVDVFIWVTYVNALPWSMLFTTNPPNRRKMMSGWTITPVLPALPSDEPPYNDLYFNLKECTIHLTEDALYLGKVKTKSAKVLAMAVMKIKVPNPHGFTSPAIMRILVVPCLVWRGHVPFSSWNTFEKRWADEGARSTLMQWWSIEKHSARPGMPRPPKPPSKRPSKLKQLSSSSTDHPISKD